MKYLLKIIFVLASTFNGALISAFIGRFFVAGKNGFDGIAAILGWLMGGAIVFLLLSIFFVKQLEGQSLKKWTLLLTGITVGLIIAIYVKSSPGKSAPEPPPQQTTKPIDK